MTSWFDELINPNAKEIKLCIEMSGNHQGSLDKALRFIDAIPRDKRVAVKFQVYTPETITLNCNKLDFQIPKTDDWAEYKNYYELYQAAHTPWDWIEQLANRCDKASIPWFASPFDTSAIEFLETLGCQAYKIASPEITDVNLISKASNTGKPLILSTGLAEWDDIDTALGTLNPEFRTRIAILKCTSAYPAELSDLNLAAIKLLKTNYHCAVGYSDHTVTSTAAVVAVALGATIIEKHFKLDGDTSSVDQHFSTPLSEASHFIELLNDAFHSIGDDQVLISKSAIPSLNGRRSLYFTSALKKGDKISANSIPSVRPSHGLHPKFMDTAIGYTLKRDVELGDRVTPQDVGLPND